VPHAVGGGYTVSDPLAMEYSEKDSVASLVQQSLIMMTGFWTTQNLTIYMPSALLAQTPHLSRFQLTLMFIIT
jgi:hypothetical protein